MPTQTAPYRHLTRILKARDDNLTLVLGVLLQKAKIVIIRWRACIAHHRYYSTCHLNTNLGQVHAATSIVADRVDDVAATANDLGDMLAVDIDGDAKVALLALHGLLFDLLN
jgi:hypothetical protein